MNSRMEGWSTDHCMLASLKYLITDAYIYICIRGHIPFLCYRSTHSNRTVRCLIVLLWLLIVLNLFLWFIIDKARILAWHKYLSCYASIMLNAFRHLLCWQTTSGNAYELVHSAPVRFYSKVEYAYIACYNLEYCIWVPLWEMSMGHTFWAVIYLNVTVLLE